MASTSFGRLFRLALGSAGGKRHLTSHVFSRPQSSLSLTRIFPRWSSSPQTERGCINSVALGKTTSTGREIWIVVDTWVQLWSLRFKVTKNSFTGRISAMVSVKSYETSPQRLLGGVPGWSWTWSSWTSCWGPRRKSFCSFLTP